MSEEGAPVRKTERLMPMQSLRFPTEEGTRRARDRFYLEELDRQATIANHGLGQAFLNGAEEPPEQDFIIWTNLQSALFACIVIQRILKPGRVYAYPHLQGGTKEAKAYADARGDRLRQMLRVPDDSPLLRVSEVRNSFEHFDEVLDKALRPEVFCITDRYVGDIVRLRSVTSGIGVTLALRYYAPIAGRLFFDERELDVFALDRALFGLRAAIAQIYDEHKRNPIAGRGLFGQFNIHTYDLDESLERVQGWLRMREEMGESLPIRIEPVERPDDKVYVSFESPDTRS